MCCCPCTARTGCSLCHACTAGVPLVTHMYPPQLGACVCGSGFKVSGLKNGNGEHRVPVTAATSTPICMQTARVPCALGAFSDKKITIPCAPAGRDRLVPHLARRGQGQRGRGAPGAGQRCGRVRGAGPHFRHPLRHPDARQVHGAGAGALCLGGCAITMIFSCYLMRLDATRALAATVSCLRSTVLASGSGPGMLRLWCAAFCAIAFAWRVSGWPAGN